MLINFHSFSTVLNISLNLDFNRRIIEAGLAVVILLPILLRIFNGYILLVFLSRTLPFLAIKMTFKMLLLVLHLLRPASFDFIKLLLRLYNSSL